MEQSTTLALNRPHPSFPMTKANGDLQAVILVGPGDRLYPLVDEAAINGASGISASGGTISSSGNTGSSSCTIPQLMNSSTSMTGSSSNPSLNPPTQAANSSTSSSNYSKAMLPLCNRPLIYYPLTWLTQNGIGGTSSYCLTSGCVNSNNFVEVFIIVQQKFHSKIANYVNRQYEHAEGTKIEVVPVMENEGSLAALLSVRHRLKVNYRCRALIGVIEFFVCRVISWF